MTRALLKRCNLELLSVLYSCNEEMPHHDGDDFHELLVDLGAELAKPAPQIPMTDDEIIGFVEKHLGLVKRKDNTVIDQKTGRFTDDARYLNFARAVEAHHGIKEKP